MFFIVLKDEETFVSPTKLTITMLKDFVIQIQEQRNVIKEEYGVCS